MDIFLVEQGEGVGIIGINSNNPNHQESKNLAYILNKCRQNPIIVVIIRHHLLLLICVHIGLCFNFGS